MQLRLKLAVMCIIFLFQVYNPKHFNQLSVGAQAYARTFPKGQNRLMDRDGVASSPKCRPHNSNGSLKNVCGPTNLRYIFLLIYGWVEDREYLL